MKDGRLLHPHSMSVCVQSVHNCGNACLPASWPRTEEVNVKVSWMRAHGFWKLSGPGSLCKDQGGGGKESPLPTSFCTLHLNPSNHNQKTHSNHSLAPNPSEGHLVHAGRLCGSAMDRYCNARMNVAHPLTPHRQVLEDHLMHARRPCGSECHGQ
eukprot:1154238-Pelagomonas_calceolata.AAC.9